MVVIGCGPVLFMVKLILSGLTLFVCVPALITLFANATNFLRFKRTITVARMITFTYLAFNHDGRFGVGIQSVFLVAALI